MANFVYKAIDTAGKEITGTLQAENEVLAAKVLTEKGFFATDIKKEADSKSNIVSKLSALLVSQKVKLGVMVSFVQQLSTLLSAGAPIFQSLDLLSKQSESPILKQTLNEVMDNVKKGDTFAQALDRFPNVFPATFVSIAKAGEAGGNLELVLEKYSQFLERQDEMIKKFQTMLTYPVFVLIIAIGVIFFVLTVVVPKFSVIFQDSGTALPASTKMLMFVSDIFRKFWWAFFLLTGASIISIIITMRTQKYQMMWDRWKLKIPIVGDLFVKIILARFSLILSTLLGSGVPIIAALKSTKGTVQNHVFAADIDRMCTEIERGSTLAASMEASVVFTPLMTQVVFVGQEVGKLEEVLLKISSFYDREADTIAKRLVALMEPAIMLLMGVAVGFLVFSVLVPILKSSSMVGGR